MAVAPQRQRYYRQWAPDTLALNILGDRWTLPIIRELMNAGAVRRADLQRRLGHVGNHLSTTLTRMEMDGLVLRYDHGSPKKPRVEYELTDLGRDALPALAAVARFGFQHAMTMPTTGDELVSLRAIFNLLPVLVEPGNNVRFADDLAIDTVVDLVVAQLDLSDHDDGPARTRAAHAEGNMGVWTLRIDHDTNVVTLEQNDDPDLDAPCTARITGLAEAWVKAIATGAQGGFSIDGDLEIADDIMALLHGSEEE